METTQVAVIGAGIAGLAVAAQLAQAGIDYAVYEQGDSFHELGAGIQLSPNGSRVLDRIGLGRWLRARAVAPTAIEMYRWYNGDALGRTDLGEDCVARYGAAYYVMRRVDLHDGLRRLVPGTVRFGRRCVAVTQDAGGARVRFANGSQVAATLVVGADGIGSAVRRAIYGGEPVATEINVYRGLVPDRIQPDRQREPRVEIWLGPGQHCVSYPVGGWTSFVASVPADGRPWSGPGRVADLLAAYEGWHPRVRELLGAATLLTRWSLREGPPLPRWSDGRVTLVGDAAHAMVPVGAQGATQALEDTAALVACLDGGRDLSPGALARYEAIRRPRIDAVAAAVREHARDHQLPDGPAQRRRDLALSGRLRLDEQAWLYGYDARAAVAA